MEKKIVVLKKEIFSLKSQKSPSLEISECYSEKCKIYFQGFLTNQYREKQYSFNDIYGVSRKKKGLKYVDEVLIKACDPNDM